MLKKRHLKRSGLHSLKLLLMRKMAMRPFLKVREPVLLTLAFGGEHSVHLSAHEIREKDGVSVGPRGGAT